MSFLPSFFTDFLQSYPFWLFDVAPIDSLGIPLFVPLFGFSRVSAPEVSVETKSFREGNWPFQRKVMVGANVSPITMERGVFWLDSDFWRWIQASIFGDPELYGTIPGPTIRRNILLMHFFAKGPFGADPPKPRSIDQLVNVNGSTQTQSVVQFSDANFTGAKIANGALGAAGLLGVSAIALGLTSQEILSASGALAAASTGAFAAAAALAPGNAIRIPAKAWLLYHCIPTRYKAASDFDASSSAISMTELDMEYERFEEISLAS